MEKNQFRLADVILSVICVVFVAEAAAPVASIGNSQYFWWIFMILAFLLPYGLIASELGTAFPGDSAQPTRETAGSMTGSTRRIRTASGRRAPRGTTGSIFHCGWRRSR